MRLSRTATLLLLAAITAPACAQQPEASAARPVATEATVPLDSVLARASRSRSKGAESAPVTLVEISDFQCPYCREFAVQTLPALDSAYLSTGKVRMLFINMPLPMHTNAWAASEAALCAGAQGAFWPMHDRIFAGQQEWSNAPNPSEIFTGYAAALRLDTTAFQRCINEDQVAPILINDIMQVARNGISGTPAFVLNDTEMLSGALPFSEFRTRIEAALAAPKNP